MGILFWRKKLIDKLEQGRRYLLQGKGNQAESVFMQLLQEQSNHLEALKGLMESWLLQSKSQAVIERFELLTKLQQDRWQELLLIALAMQVGHLKKEGYMEWLRLPADNTKRLVQLRKLAQRYTKCGALTIQWAEAALIASQIEEADQALRQLRDAEPRISPKLIAHLYAQRDALMLLENPHISQAIDEAADLDSTDERLALLLPLAQQEMGIAPLQREVGLAFFEQGRPEIAIRYLNRAANLNPYWLNVWIELGLAAASSRRLVRAREALVRSLYLNDSDWIAQIHQEIEIKLIEYPELAQIEIALDRIDIGDDRGAIEPLQKALEINPQRLEIKWIMGKALATLEDFGRAASYLRDVLDNLDEHDTNLHQQVISTLEQCLHHKLLGFLEDNWLEESKEMLSEEPNLERDFPLLVEDREIIEQIEQQQLPIQALMLYEKGRPVEDFVLYERLPYLKTALELAPNFAQARIAYAIVLAEKGHLGQAQTEMEKAIAQLKTPQIGWFHLAGIAFLRQDIETAKALWRRCFESNMQPWREYAADNLEAIASRNTTRLLIVALPTYHRVVEFTSNSAILSADRSSSDSLFRTTPSVELKTLSFPLETARKQAQIEIPRFSEVVGMSELENNINKNQLDAEHIAAKRQQILGETKKLSEVAIFDLSQAPEQEHTASSSFLSDYELDEHLSSHSTTNDYSTQAPLFDISPSVETNSPDFSIELAPQEAIAKIPLLSEVAPTYPEQQPPIASQSPTDKNIDPQNFDQSLKPGVPQNFNQAPTPRVPDVSPQAPNAPVESSQPSEMKRKNIILANSTTCKIFSKHEDIDSFIDEVFADLEHHSQPDLPEYQDKSSDNSK